MRVDPAVADPRLVQMVRTAKKAAGVRNCTLWPHKGMDVLDKKAVLAWDLLRPSLLGEDPVEVACAVFPQLNWPLPGDGCSLQRILRPLLFSHITTQQLATIAGVPRIALHMYIIWNQDQLTAEDKQKLEVLVGKVNWAALRKLDPRELTSTRIVPGSIRKRTK